MLKTWNESVQSRLTRPTRETGMYRFLGPVCNHVLYLYHVSTGSNWIGLFIRNKCILDYYILTYHARIGLMDHNLYLEPISQTLPPKSPHTKFRAVNSLVIYHQKAWYDWFENWDPIELCGRRLGPDLCSDPVGQKVEFQGLRVNSTIHKHHTDHIIFVLSFDI